MGHVPPPPPLDLPVPPPVGEFQIVIESDDERAVRNQRRQSVLAASWLASIAVHLVIVIFLLLLLVPMAHRAMEVLTFELTMEEPEIVALAELTPVPEIADLGLPDIEPLTDPETMDSSWLRTSVMGPMSGQGHASNQGAQSGDNAAAGRATFFGANAYGNEFLYIVDISGSMKTKGANNRTRLSRALAELLQSVDQLTAEQFFYVMLFSSDTRLMMDESKKYPVMVPATAENKERLRKWIAKVGSGGGTNPRSALRVGLRMNPSAVFFLSDGEFNRSRNTGNRLLKEQSDVFKIIDTNNIAGAPIHTIAFEDPVNSSTLSKMSNATGGEHRFVSSVEFTSSDPAATRLMTQAIQGEKTGSKRAITKYEQVVKQFPGTSEAKAAAERIAELRNND